MFLAQNNSGEKSEHLYAKLKKTAANCDFENKTEALIRDVFITDLIDPGLQKELLKQTMELRKAFELTLNIELGIKTSANYKLTKKLRQALLQCKNHPELAPPNGLSQKICTGKALVHHHFTAPIMGHYGFLDTNLSALPKKDL